MTRPVNIRDPASSRGFTRGSWAAASITLLLITGPRLQIVLGSPMRFERITGNPEVIHLDVKPASVPVADYTDMWIAFHCQRVTWRFTTS